MENNQRQAYFDVLLINLPIVLFTTDQNGIITFSEGQGLQRLGIPSERLVGRPVSLTCDTFFPRDTENILHHFYRALALDGEPVHSVGTAGHMVFDIQYNPIWDEQDMFTGVAGIALDITEQARAQSAPTRMRAGFAQGRGLHHLDLNEGRLKQRAHPRIPAAPLTEREIALMRLLVAGNKLRIISQKLKISERMVGYDLQSIMSKLGVSSHAEAICRVLELGLLKE